MRFTIFGFTLAIGWFLAAIVLAIAVTARNSDERLGHRTIAMADRRDGTRRDGHFL